MKGLEHLSCKTAEGVKELLFGKRGRKLPEMRFHSKSTDWWEMWWSRAAILQTESTF